MGKIHLFLMLANQSAAIRSNLSVQVCLGGAMGTISLCLDTCVDALFRSVSCIFLSHP